MVEPFFLHSHKILSFLYFAIFEVGFQNVKNEDKVKFLWNVKTSDQCGVMGYWGR